MIQRYCLRLGFDGDPRDYLRKQVREDLATKGAAELYKQYGAYYVNAIYVGAMATISSTTDTTKFSSSEEIQVAAKASYKALVGQIDVEADLKIQKQVERFEESSQRRSRVRGGDETAARDLVDEGEYDRWLDSVRNDHNLVMVGFHEQDGLLPIWELAADDRIEELRLDYERYLEENFPMAFAPSLVPVFAFRFKELELVKWAYSIREDDLLHWERQPEFEFMGFDPELPDFDAERLGTVPIYRFEKRAPYELGGWFEPIEGIESYRLSQSEEAESDEVNIGVAFHAFAESTRGAVSTWEHRRNKSSLEPHGCHYSTDRRVNDSWDPTGGIAFYTPIPLQREDP